MGKGLLRSAHLKCAAASVGVLATILVWLEVARWLRVIPYYLSPSFETAVSPQMCPKAGKWSLGSTARVLQFYWKALLSLWEGLFMASQLWLCFTSWNAKGEWEAGNLILIETLGDHERGQKEKREYHKSSAVRARGVTLSWEHGSAYRSLTCAMEMPAALTSTEVGSRFGSFWSPRARGYDFTHFFLPCPLWWEKPYLFMRATSRFCSV